MIAFLAHVNHPEASRLIEVDMEPIQKKVLSKLSKYIIMLILHCRSAAIYILNQERGHQPLEVQEEASLL
jgi:hypothetical protein